MAENKNLQDLLNVDIGSITEEAKKRKKKQKKLAVVLVIVAIIIGALALVYQNVVRPAMNYRAAEKLADAGQYEEAIAAFQELGEYKDATERILEARYAQASSLAAEGNYSEAIARFNALGDYSDAKERIQGVYYDQGVSLLRGDDLGAAKAAFRACNAYHDAEQQLEAVNETAYTRGLGLMEAGDYNGAYEMFIVSGYDYKDGGDYINYCRIKATDFDDGQLHSLGIFALLDLISDESLKAELQELRQYKTLLRLQGKWSNGGYRWDEETLEISGARVAHKYYSDYDRKWETISWDISYCKSKINGSEYSIYRTSIDDDYYEVLRRNADGSISTVVRSKNPDGSRGVIDGYTITYHEQS